MNGIDMSKLGEMLSGLNNSDFFKSMQDNIQKMQDELAAKEYTAKSGGGMVEVKINGAFEVIDLNIDNSLLEDKESLQILLMTAINDAIKMSLQDKTSMLNPFGMR